MAEVVSDDETDEVPRHEASSSSKQGQVPVSASSDVGMGPPAGGFKGYGKGNYGREIPPPTPLKPEKEEGAVVFPDARMPTAEEVNEWVEQYYEKLPAGDATPRKGVVVLWRGFKKGKRGAPSTTSEFFRGVIHHVTKVNKGTYDDVT